MTPSLCPAGPREVCLRTDAKFIPQADDAPPRRIYRRRMASATDLLVETKGLTKRYRRLLAVDSLNLTVRRGEVYGFLGPNGAGKTTTLRMLVGLVRPAAGSAMVAHAISWRRWNSFVTVRL